MARSALSNPPRSLLWRITRSLQNQAKAFSGLERFPAGAPKGRSPSPKLVFWNNALATALQPRSFAQARSDRESWGRLVENAVGAHLLSHLQGEPFEVTYWRDRGGEIDYLVRTPQSLWAIEVRSGRSRGRGALPAFRAGHERCGVLEVGFGGVPLEEFFAADPREYLAGR